MTDVEAEVEVATPRDSLRALLPQAHRFELTALMDVLAQRFPDHLVRFQSKRSFRAEHSLVDSVIETREAGRLVALVTLNTGIFSASSPLPSYFTKLLDDPHVAPALERVLRVIDDSLLRAEAYSFRAETAWRTPAQIVALRRNLLWSGQIASPSTLAYILEAAYPELTVGVRRGDFPCIVRTRQALVGYAVLGEDALGDSSLGTMPGLRATLSGARSNWTNADWANEAPQRLREIVLPTLEGSGLRFVLTIDLCEQTPSLALDGVAMEFAALEGGSAEALVLFDGVVA